MTAPQPAPAPPRAWAVVAARFHASIVDRLLESALGALRARGVGSADLVVVRAPGAFELPQAAAALLLHPAEGARPFRGLVALGCVVRGETPHFDYVCSAAAMGLQDVAVRSGTPIGFGVLTCDTIAQAMARAGGDRGDKGLEAAEAAWQLADELERAKAR